MTTGKHALTVARAVAIVEAKERHPMSTQEPRRPVTVPGWEAGSGPVVLTPKAVEKVKELLARQGRQGQGIRVSVRDGGCSGHSYVMDFAPGPAEGDLVIEQDGAALYVDAAAVPYLDGTTIDYVSGLHNAGFRFVNPQATRTCGCGESFGV
jgi:iron-sulfur cluster assembly accessory protein